MKTDKCQFKKGDTIEILEDWCSVIKGEKYVINHTNDYPRTISIVKPRGGNSDGNYNIYPRNAKLTELNYEIY